jgi:predicted negative regulator of RcsB-dependent stress response
MTTRFATLPTRFQWKRTGWPLLMGALLALNIWLNWGTINETHPQVLFGMLGLAGCFGAALMLLRSR